MSDQKAAFHHISTKHADLYLTEWRSSPAKSWLWDLPATLGWAAILPITYMRWHWEVMLPVVMFVAYVGAFRGVIWNRIVANRWLATIGGMCYTTYLYHCQVISFFGRIITRLGHFSLDWVTLIVFVVLLATVSIAVSAVFFVFLEKPFMYTDWPRRWRAAIELAHRKGREARA